MIYGVETKKKNMFWVFLEAQEEVKDAMVFKTSLREVLYSKCFLTKATSELLADPGEARDCSTNTSVIHSFSHSCSDGL